MLSIVGCYWFTFQPAVDKGSFPAFVVRCKNKLSFFGFRVLIVV